MPPRPHSAPSRSHRYQLAHVHITGQCLAVLTALTHDTRIHER